MTARSVAACVAEAEAVGESSGEAGEASVTVEAPDDVVTHYATVRRRESAGQVGSP